MNKQIILILIINGLLAISTSVGMTIIPIITINAGISLLSIGFIEGFAEFLSNFVKLYAGRFYDTMKNKNKIFIVSCFISSISKMCLFFPNLICILMSKLLERLSNGLYCTPRDAFMLQVSYNNSIVMSIASIFKTVGCTLGSLAIGYLCYKFGEFELIKDYAIWFVIWVSVFSIFLASKLTNILIIKSTKTSLMYEVLKIIKDTSNQYKTLRVIFICGFFFFLSRFNDGLLILYLKSLNYPDWYFTSTIGIFNTAMIVVAPIIGILLNRYAVKLVSFIVMLSMLIFNFIMIYIGILEIDYTLATTALILWGAQRVGSQMLFTNLVYTFSDRKNTGSTLGIFYLLIGIATLMTSTFSSYLASINYSYIFMSSFFFSMFSILFLIVYLEIMKVYK